MPESKIPEFRSIEDEAKFWDTHDFTEFEDELEEVTDLRLLPVRAGNWLAFPLGEAAMATLQRLASERGLRPEDVAREWVLERLARGDAA